jgi:hypothetical protein
MATPARRGAEDDDGCTMLPSRTSTRLGKSRLDPSVREQPPPGKWQGSGRPPPSRGLPNAEEAWAMAELFRLGLGAKTRTSTRAWVSKEA